MYYDFRTKQVDGQSLIHLINLHLGDDLVGAEIGVWQAQTTCALVQSCPGIKKIYAVDPFLPYIDSIEPGSQRIVDAKQIEMIRTIAYHNARWSGQESRIEFIEQPSNTAVRQIKDEELDFVFIDSYCSVDQVLQELELWYPKVKNGGLFSGHDYISPFVIEGVEQFRNKYKITSKMSVFDQTFVWIK